MIRITSQLILCLTIIGLAFSTPQLATAQTFDPDEAEIQTGGIDLNELVNVTSGTVLLVADDKPKGEKYKCKPSPKDVSERVDRCLKIGVGYPSATHLCSQKHCNGKYTVCEYNWDGSVKSEKSYTCPKKKAAKKKKARTGSGNGAPSVPVALD